MNLFAKLQTQAASGRPVRAGLIGAGKFGSMFLSQAPTTPGLEVTAKRDLGRGETLDGEGGFCVYGKLAPAADALARGPCRSDWPMASRCCVRSRRAGW